MNFLTFRPASEALRIASFALLGGLLTLSCTKPKSETCDTDLVCPVGSSCSGDGTVCIYDECGDGEIQSAEVCDDGNITDGDGCSADCLSSEGCGDGILNEAAGEVCDDGNTDAGDGCDSSCRSLEECGNRITDVGEMCDDGNTESGDGCREDCLSDEECGTGVVDAHKGEVCDPGLTPDSCDDTCRSDLACGNSIVDLSVNEECDDGEDGDDTDYCTGGCVLAYCGDGHTLLAPENPEDDTEECDNGAEGSTTCNPDCTLVGADPCGDGVINTALNEVCDDGPKNGTYGRCDGDCAVVLACGDERVTAPEACDPSVPVSQSDTEGNMLTCKDDCSGFLAHCGDGISDPGEECDYGDANQDGLYNGCTASCSLGPYCGDGNFNQDHEECDNGTGSTGGNVETPLWSSAAPQCSTACTTGPACGDKLLQPASEACERGNIVMVEGPDGTELPSQCHDDCLGFCGDGAVQGATRFQTADEQASFSDFGETCDLGPHLTIGTNGKAVGNGADQNNDALFSLSNECRTDCTRCGDGVVQTAHEGCDLGASNSTSTSSNLVSCRANCTKCGDGTRDPSEKCDLGTANVNSAAAGILTCRRDCTKCGDGKINGAEECELGDLLPTGTTPPRVLCQSDCTKPALAL